MRAPDALVTSEGGEHSDGLDGLAEAHFVGKNAIQTLVVQGDEPINSNNLILTQGAPQHKWHLCINVGALQREPRWQECLRHFNCRFGNINNFFGFILLLLLHLLLRGRLYFTGYFHLLLERDHLELALGGVFSGFFLLVLGLFEKLVCVEFFRNFDTEFQMLAHEVFQASGPGLLLLFLVLHPIIVLYDLFDTLPVQSDHFGHRVGLSAEIDSHLSFLPLNFGLLLSKRFFDITGVDFAIFLLFFGLASEIFTHPDHFFQHKF